MTKGKLSPLDKNQERLIGIDNKDLGSRSNVVATYVIPPDGGWGWMVVLASFLIHVISDGIVYSFGVFMMEFIVYFKAGRAAVSWIGALQPAVTFTVGPLASVLTKRYGCRKVTIAGAIIAAAGFMGSALAPNLYYLYFTSGVVAGVGFGLIYLPAIVCVAQYFEKKRSLAVGLAVCGSGFGTFILAPLTGLLVREFSWKGAMLILGGVILSVVICGLMFRPLTADVVTPRKTLTEGGALLNDVDLEMSLSMRDRTISSMRNGADSAESKSLSECGEDMEIDNVEATMVRAKNNFIQVYNGQQNSSPNSGVAVMGKGNNRRNRNNQQSAASNNMDALGGQSSGHTTGDIRDTDWSEGSDLSADAQTQDQPVGNQLLTSDLPNRQLANNQPLNINLPRSENENGDIPRYQAQNRYYSRSEPLYSDIPWYEPQNSLILKSELQNSHHPKSEPQNSQFKVYKHQQHRNPTLYEPQNISNPISTPQESPHLQSKPTNSARYVSSLHKPLALHVHSDTALVLSLPTGKSLLRSSASTPRQKTYKSSEPTSHSLTHSTTPLSRKDVFYTGSLKNIPMYRSQPEVYKATMTYGLEQDTGSLAEVEEKQGRGCVNCSQDVHDTIKDMFSITLLKNPVFLMFALSNFFTSLGFNMPFIFLPDRAKLAGINEAKAALLLSVIGIANTAGRVFFGFLSDRAWVNRLTLYNTALTICGVVTALSPLAGGDYLLLVTYAAVFGVFIGVYVSLTSVVLVDLLGLDYLTNSFGLLLLFQGAATFVGPPLAGALCDWTGSYDTSFLVMGSLVALSGIVLYFLPLVQRHTARPLSTAHTIRDLELGRKPVTDEDVAIMCTQSI